MVDNLPEAPSGKYRVERVIHLYRIAAALIGDFTRTSDAAEIMNSSNQGLRAIHSGL